MNDSKIPTVYEDGNTRVIKLNVRTTPANESPAEFKPYYIRVPKNVPDYILREICMGEADRITRDGLYKTRFIRGVDLLKKRRHNDNY